MLKTKREMTSVWFVVLVFGLASANTIPDTNNLTPNLVNQQVDNVVNSLGNTKPLNLTTNTTENSTAANEELEKLANVTVELARAAAHVKTLDELVVDLRNQLHEAERRELVPKGESDELREAALRASRDLLTSDQPAMTLAAELRQSYQSYSPALQQSLTDTESAFKRATEATEAAITTLESLKSNQQATTPATNAHTIAATQAALATAQQSLVTARDTHQRLTNTHKLITLSIARRQQQRLSRDQQSNLRDGTVRTRQTDVVALKEAVVKSKPAQSDDGDVTVAEHKQRRQFRDSNSNSTHQCTQHGFLSSPQASGWLRSVVGLPVECSAVTVAVWVKLAPSDGGAVTVASIFNKGREKFELELKNGSEIRLFVDGPSQSHKMAPLINLELCDNSWHHVVVSWSHIGGEAVAFVDGKFVARHWGVGGAGGVGEVCGISEGSIVSFGRRAVVTTEMFQLNGLMRDAYVFCGRLPPADVLDVAKRNSYHGPLPYSHWALNQNTGESVVDLGTMAMAGKVEGGKWRTIPDAPSYSLLPQYVEPEIDCSEK